MDRVDTTLLFVMPFMFAAKTGAFAVLTAIMLRQDNSSSLAKQILRLFASVTLVSVTLTVLFAVFAWKWHDADLIGWVLIMVPLDVGAALTAYFGLRVMQEQGRGNNDEYPS